MFSNQTCASVAMLIFCPVLGGADDVNVEDFLTCSKVMQDTARLDCYDSTSRAIIIDETPAMPVQQQNVPLTDDVGLPSHRRQEAEEEPNVRAEVTRCQLGGTGKYIFYFDNGQVWQQTGTTRQDFEDCSFFVTFSQDAFGYRMLPDGQSRKIRISRLK